jgi:starch-binding outer membrane protein SusE/F
MKKIFTLLTALVLGATSYAQFASVGIIGSAVPPYDWSVDIDMLTLDGETYAGIVTCVDGAAKFRQDDAWTINWGSTTFPAGLGTQGGADIPVPAGTYLVVFNKTTGAYSFQTTFDVTYKVDVTNYLTANTLAANGIRVGGNFTDNGATVAAGPVANWSPGDANSAMTDEGNNIWSITVSYPVASIGATQFYKFVNGDWGANEGTDPANTIAVDSCGVDDGAGNINRTYALMPGTVCYVWDACTACGVSVAENAIANLTVAPNPATDVVNFTFEANNAAIATVTIFDLAGKAVATQTVATSATTTVEMNTTALQAGSYIYNVVAGDKVATGKLIKQ